jgi:dTMP kinase
MIPNPYRGRFIALEGVDGCGKSKQLELLLGWIIRRGNTVLTTKEPNKNGLYGSRIYKDLANPIGLNKTNPFGFQTWYACDSKENLRKRIIPQLRAGCSIITDRFRPSMVYGAKIPQEIAGLMAMNQSILGEDFIWPDATFIFDVRVETAIRRLREKNSKLDEHEKAEVLERVRSNYRYFSDAYPECHLISGEGSPEDVFEKVKLIVTPIFNKLAAIV